MRKVVKILSCLVLAFTLMGVSTAPAVAAGDVDLEPTQMLMTTLYAGANNAVTVVVANNGADNVTSYDVKLEAYNSATGNTTTVDTKTVASMLGKNETYYWPAYINFSWAPAASGNYTLTATVDPSGSIAETTTANNVLAESVTVIDLAPVTLKVRVEGQTSTIWSGNVTFSTSTITDAENNVHTYNYPTVLGALDAAATAGGFSYVLTSSLYISEVSGEAEVLTSPWPGWMFRVDYASPDVGAGDYALSDSDIEVVWYYGVYGAQPLRLTVGSTSIPSTDNLTALVESYDEVNWNPLPGATLHAGERIYTTDANGEVNVSLPPGLYQVYADKGDYSQYIRSNTEACLVYVSFNLQPGWNFISVPKKLASDNCTAAEVFDGVNSDGRPIFYYASGSWSAMSADTVVSPLEGIWIYSAEIKELRPQFDSNPQQVPPTKQLSAGWNAIGFTDFAIATANSALTSVENEWSILLGFNAVTQTYETSIINGAPNGDTHSETRGMECWKGYWLYMTSAGELAAISS